MKLIHKALLLLCICLSALSQAQITITGKVVDSATREPLAGASVFAQNTTQGTVTNSSGEFSLPLKSGGYELIFSFTGYTTQQLQVTDNKSQRLEVAMLKEDKTLGEVVIQSSNEVIDGWEKYGTFFINNFIGNTPFAKKCTILNKDVVKFFYYRRSDKLKVFATEPIQISNEATGYDLRYQLDSFVYYYKTDLSSYRGTCLFTEKTGSMPQELLWKKNRSKAYYGSKMQFMRAMYDSTLTKDGFTVSLMNEGSNGVFSRLPNPLAADFYARYDSLEQVEVYYPNKISVAYLKSAPDDDYLKQYKLPMDIGIQISYIDMMDLIAIKKNGYYFEQKDWVNQGYWSWKNLADLLPFDYMP